ncbi:hypothetical protein FRC00_007171 [Tulasnella sp. 408]|nr:hypothetical protein FRC00_007171 [Tulasnella sp. 408]
MPSETLVITPAQVVQPFPAAPPPIPVPPTHADGLHQMHLLSLGGLYPASDLVERALINRKDGSTPHVLDVGTGSGIWAREVAQKFPKVQVVGIDLNPVPIMTETPSNCSFEVRDATSVESLKGLGQVVKFDVIHIRALDNGIHDYKQVIDNASEVLRPGGVLLLASVGMYAYDEEKKLLPSTASEGRKPSALGCLFSALLNKDERRMLSGLGRIGSMETRGPWMEDGERSEQAIGALTRENTLGIMDISEKMLIQAGYEPELVKEWVAGSRREIKAQEPRVYKLFRYAWATRTSV